MVAGFLKPHLSDNIKSTIKEPPICRNGTGDIFY